MLECMNRLGRDVQIVVRKPSRSRATGRTSVVFAWGQHLAEHPVGIVAALRSQDSMNALFATEAKRKMVAWRGATVALALVYAGHDQILGIARGDVRRWPLACSRPRPVAW